ncbi:MAG: hypothetical protein FWH55_10985 [Oscillospiraceae bacterium]|nr:hypothetical protein [Oscillospiraceae bacterium]
MPTQLSTIHNDVVSTAIQKIDATSEEVEGIISKSVEGLVNGRIPSAGKAYEDHVRNIRRNALVRYSSTKAWLCTHILGTVIQQIRTSGLYRLHETIEAVNATDATRTKAIDERARIYNDEEPLADFEKFVLFGEPEFDSLKENILVRTLKRLKRKNNEPSNNNAAATSKQKSSAITQTYEKYSSKKNMSLLAGIIVTFLCAAADFSIIYAVFQSANLGIGLSAVTAIISAAVLDAPLYVLGYLWTKRDDSRRLWKLRNESNDSGAANEMKRYSITIKALFSVILLIFIAYLVLRILLFLGGGNFNLALHTILDGEFKFTSTDFNAADLLSTFVPLGTSAVAFAVGMLLFSSHTDLVKNTITIIKKELKERIKKCDETIVDCDEKQKNLREEIPALKREIWTFYLGNKSFPLDDVTFREQVSISFQKLNLSLYVQTYTTCSLLLRDKAVAMLQNINSSLAPYAADQAAIASMQISADEESVLDDFWVKSVGGSVKPQHTATINDIKLIEDQVTQLMKTLA